MPSPPPPRGTLARCRSHLAHPHPALLAPAPAPPPPVACLDPPSAARPLPQSTSLWTPARPPPSTLWGRQCTSWQSCMPSFSTPLPCSASRVRACAGLGAGCRAPTYCRRAHTGAPPLATRPHPLQTTRRWRAPRCTTPWCSTRLCSCRRVLCMMCVLCCSAALRPHAGHAHPALLCSVHALPPTSLPSRRPPARPPAPAALQSAQRPQNPRLVARLGGPARRPHLPRHPGLRDCAADPHRAGTLLGRADRAGPGACTRVKDVPAAATRRSQLVRRRHPSLPEPPARPSRPSRPAVWGRVVSHTPAGCSRVGRVCGPGRHHAALERGPAARAIRPVRAGYGRGEGAGAARAAAPRPLAAASPR